MSRIDPARFRTRPTHEDTQIALLQVLTKLVITVQHKEPIIYVLAGETCGAIQAAIPDISSCNPRGAILVHGELIDWLQRLEKTLNENPSAITLDRLERGRGLVAALDTCRTDRASY